MLKLSLTLYTFSITGLVADLFLILELDSLKDRQDVAGLETGQVVTVIGRGRAHEISCLVSKVRKRHKMKGKYFTLSLMLFVSDQSESDFSLWYINSYLNIRIRY